MYQNDRVKYIGKSRSAEVKSTVEFIVLQSFVVDGKEYITLTALPTRNFLACDFEKVKPSARERFLNTYHGARLIENYPLNKFGQWKVEGEDSNPDFGGSHHQPDLGTYEGTLSDIIDMAVTLSNFWQWGGGGNITLVPDYQNQPVENFPSVKRIA